MQKISLILLVISSAALIGCGKKPAESKPVATEQTAERVSGTHAAVDIKWEEEDLK
jgi:hypothetical protein